MNPVTYMIHYGAELNRPPAGPYVMSEVMEIIRETEEPILYIEDLSMQSFLTDCLRLMQAGIVFPNGRSDITLYYHDGSYYAGEQELSMLEVRRSLQVYYHSHREAYEEDREYVTQKVTVLI